MRTLCWKSRDGSGPEKQRAWPSILSAVIAAVGSLTVGYAMGYSSSALLDLAELGGGLAIQTGSMESKLFVALLPIGATLSSPLGGLIADRTGRKKALLMTGPMNFIGWLMVGVAPYTANITAFKVLLLGGRLVNGFAVGWLCATVPVYAAEVSTSKCRGQLTAFYQLSIVVGITLSYAIGVIPSVTYSQSALVAMGIVAMFELLVAFVICESPRWLFSVGHADNAEKTLSWLRQSQEVAREEAAEIKKLLLTSPRLPLKQKLLEFRQRHVFIPLILSLILIFFHQFSGINVIIAYAATIFQSAAVDNARAMAFYVVGALQLVAVAICSCLVDKLGRKILLVLGSIGMFLSSTALGTHFYLVQDSDCQTDSTNASNMTEISGDDVCNSHLAPLAISSLVLFCVAFSVGWRALPFIVMSELFPLHLRGVLNGVGICTLWLYAGIVTGFYPDFEEAAGAHTAWWSFALVSFAGILFVIFCIPETKGKSLEELEKHFNPKLVQELAEPV